VPGSRARPAGRLGPVEVLDVVEVGDVPDVVDAAVVYVVMAATSATSRPHQAGDGPEAEVPGGAPSRLSDR
jgi:hypothetical protein